MTYLVATEVGSLFGLVEFRIGIVMQVINTIILFLFLRHFLFGPVTEFMEKRQNGIQSSLDDAASKVAEAEALKAEYQSKLANIRDEELDILKKARLTAEQRTQQMIKDAEREIADRKRKAEDDIQRERVTSINHLKDDIAGLAMLAASKVVDAEIDGAKHVSLIDDVIAKVGDAQWLN